MYSTLAGEVKETISVLVVDDMSNWFDIYRFIINDVYGREVTLDTAVDSDTAIFKIRKNHYDLIIVDFSLYPLTGPQLIYHIRNENLIDEKNTAIIAFTTVHGFKISQFNALGIPHAHKANLEDMKRLLINALVGIRLGTGRDEEREHRIAAEVIQGAYSLEEQALGWYYYLDSKINSPFNARYNKARYDKVAVTVMGMASKGDCTHDMFVKIELEGQTLSVPLERIDLEPACEEPRNVTYEVYLAITDWHYWVRRGYRLFSDDGD
jgi:CheY-like chemotaxis protein